MPIPIKVAVVGLGYTARAAIRSLNTAGVGRFHLVDGPQRPEPGVVEALRTSFPNVEFTYQSSDATAASEGSWLTGSDLCLLTVDSVHPDHCLAVNAACVSAGVPLLPGLGMGDVGQVGPRIVGGDGACLQCIDMRAVSTLGRRALAGPYPANPALAEAVGEALAARATRWTEAGAENLLVYVWANGVRTEHHALRSAACPTCGAREPGPPFVAPTELNLDAELDGDRTRILGLQPLIVDNIVGLVRWITAYLPQPNEPQLAYAVASVAHPEWTQTGQELYAGGSDLNPSPAKAAALGEALDRLATADPGPNRLQIAPYRDVAAYAVDPARFDLFHPETRRQHGFPYHAPDASAPISWVWSWSVARGRAFLVPAWRVFTRLRSATPADQMDVTNVSGCATGSSVASAVLGGLLEVIERDSFMIAWATRLPVTGVNIERDTPWDVGRFVAAFADVGIEVRCSTVTLDWGVPVVFAIAKSPHGGDPAAVVAAAADPDLSCAMRCALKELAANFVHVRHAMKSTAGPQAADVASVRTQDHHALLYARPDMARQLEPWWAPAACVEAPEPENPSAAEALSAISERCIATGSDILAVDLSFSELRRRGLFTFKTLVPGAYPMNFDTLWPHFGGKRMQQAPVDAGLLSKPVTFANLNRFPHPFP
jgi:ribosomal protein S12 methylthiotransferase accessory factor